MRVPSLGLYTHSSVRRPPGYQSSIRTVYSPTMDAKPVILHYSKLLFLESVICFYGILLCYLSTVSFPSVFWHYSIPVTIVSLSGRMSTYIQFVCLSVWICMLIFDLIQYMWSNCLPYMSACPIISVCQNFYHFWTYFTVSHINICYIFGLTCLGIPDISQQVENC
jgi:hypothetical protein